LLEQQALEVVIKFRSSKERAQRRTREEAARLEDQAANNTDTSLARDPRNLEPLEGVRIDRTRQVAAKDFFALDLTHSTGQRFACQAELLLRDKPKDESDPGDLLICEVDTEKRALLFPPIELDHISARLGRHPTELVIMIRGIQGSAEWREVVTLKADDEDTVKEWMTMFDLSPIPPLELNFPTAPELPEQCTAPEDLTHDDRVSVRPPSPVPSEIPIGVRVRHKVYSRPTSKAGPQYPTANSPSMFARFSKHFRASPKKNDVIDWEAADRKNMNSSRYHSRSKSDTSAMQERHEELESERAATRSPSQDRSDSPDEDTLSSVPIHRHNRRPSTPSRELPYIPKRRSSTTPPETPVKGGIRSSPLKESTTPDDYFTRAEDTIANQPVQYRDDGAPAPPKHRSTAPLNLNNAPKLEPSISRQQTRRSSSPLKHEYQPSAASGTSLSSEVTESEEFSYTESEDMSAEEMSEMDDLVTPLGGLDMEQRSPPESTYSVPNASLAPSNSASQVQAPMYDTPASRPIEVRKFIAHVHAWNDKGHWDLLHHEICSVVVSGGLVEVYKMSPAHSSPQGKGFIDSSGSPDVNTNNDTGAERPLLAFELTPVVPMRQGNATNIDIRSPPLPRSLVRPSGPVMFKSRNPQEAAAMYNALHISRMNNPKFLQLERERLANYYNTQAYSEAPTSSKRSKWSFGRKKSYRAHTRAPSTSPSGDSSSSLPSAFSALLRGGARFNIAKSTLNKHNNGVSTPQSLYSSGPGTPNSAESGSIATGWSLSNPINLGTSNINIRLHLYAGSGRWMDYGPALLTVSSPPPNRRQASTLYNGIPRYIFITSRPKKGKEGGKGAVDEKAKTVWVDAVLGSGCFQRHGVCGIAMNLWEEKEVGRVGGVVAGRMRKWMLQLGGGREVGWVWGLLGAGVQIGG
jgi:hypothetical protein